MLFKDACKSYIDYIRFERGLSKLTAINYHERINSYRKWLVGEGVDVENGSLDECFTPNLVRGYLHFLAAKGEFRPRTIRNRLCPLRSLADWLVEGQHLSSSPCARIKTPKPDAARRDTVSDQELTKMFEAVELQSSPRRVALERAMLYTLAMTGVRWAEFLDIRIQDISLGDKTLLVAHGKGEKSRLLYPPDECLLAIADWLRERVRMKCRHDYLWAYSVTRRMGDLGSRAMLEDIKARAGLPYNHNIKPHSLRRAFATRMLRNKADIRSIQAALGHSDAQTTLLYLKHHEQPAKAMAETARIAQPVSALVVPDTPTPAPAPPLKPNRAADMRSRRTRQASR